MAAHFHVDKFGDCDVITDPSEKLHIYMVIRGSACVIADDRTYKTANKQVKRTRHKRRKAAEKRAAEVEAGLADPEPENQDEKAQKPKEEAKKPTAKPEGEGAEGKEGKAGEEE